MRKEKYFVLDLTSNFYMRIRIHKYSSSSNSLVNLSLCSLSSMVNKRRVH
jgi:hypothetical protein